MKKLNEELEKKMFELDAKANEYYENEDWDMAIDTYKQQYELLPEPKDEYDWGYGALEMIGSVYYKKRDFKQAKSYLTKALASPVYTGSYKQDMNAPINWELGKILYQEGDKEGALEYFKAAWGLIEIEDENPKYEEFIRAHLDVDTPY